MPACRPQLHDSASFRAGAAFSVPSAPDRADAEARPGVALELPDAVDVLGLPLRPLDTPQLIAHLVARALVRAPTTACYANAHTVNLACRDARFRACLAGCDLLFADGAAVVWASRYSDRRLPERMTACDYFPVLAAACAEAGIRVYLLGGRPGVADRAAERLADVLPQLRIAGAHHGHFDTDRSDEIVARINAARPHLLLVGMGSPRQEFWLAGQAGALRPPVRLCVGALLDYVAGVEPRAPQWLCRMGCEWVYRLMVDPRGKWRRYLLGNPEFVWHMLRWRRRRSRGGRGGRDGESIESVAETRSELVSAGSARAGSAPSRPEYARALNLPTAQRP